ncbi:MAG: hypothetical protein WCR34_01670 [Bacilli bacterium]|jgi:hypothetical protein
MIKKTIQVKLLFLSFSATIPMLLLVIGSSQGMNNLIESAKAGITEYSIYFNSSHNNNLPATGNGTFTAYTDLGNPVNFYCSSCSSAENAWLKLNWTMCQFRNTDSITGIMEIAIEFVGTPDITVTLGNAYPTSTYMYFPSSTSWSQTFTSNLPSYFQFGEHNENNDTYISSLIITYIC